MSALLFGIAAVWAAAADGDGDGYDAALDCNDGDPGVNPGVREVLDDGVDQDCTGADLTGLYSLAPGDLVIHEILADPTAALDADGEWFEIYNPTAVDVDLYKLVLADLGIDFYQELGHPILPAHGYLLAGKSNVRPLNGDVDVAIVFGASMSLANSKDELQLWGIGVVLDAVSWDGGLTFPDPTGASLSLDPGSVDAGANDLGTVWCAAISPFGLGDLGTPLARNDACGQPVVEDADGDGTAAEADCDDADPEVYPGAPERCNAVDDDCDGIVPADEQDGDLDGFSACGGDCDDASAKSYPGAPEGCDEGDLDCDGTAQLLIPLFLDADRDGYGGSLPVEGCAPSPGAADRAGDCNDGDAAVNPGMSEACGGGDEDCDGLTDDADPSVVDAVAWYGDGDGDGVGAGVPTVACAVADAVTASGDCDDADAGAYPGAPEACTDAQDRDCDGQVTYVDADGDLWAGCVDCDDANPSVNPDADEVCGGLDEDCDGAVDDADPSVVGAPTWYVDGDEDGAGGAPLGDACVQPAGSVGTDGDCDDADPNRAPGAEEIPDDGIDQDCDGVDRFGGFGEDTGRPPPPDPGADQDDSGVGAPSGCAHTRLGAGLAVALAAAAVRRRRR